MGFLDMFDNPDIMSTLMGGLPSSMATAPPAAPPPQPQPGLSSPTVPGPPMEQNTGLNVPDQTPPQPPMGGGPMAGTGITPPVGGPGQAAAAGAPARGLAPLAPLPGPVGGAAGPTGPGTIPTNVGPIQPPPQGPLNIQPALRPPPSAYAERPPLTHLADLAAALGISKQQRIGNAITAGMAGLGKGLTAVGQARPGASGAQMFAAGAGGGLSGGIEEVDRQQKQRMAERKQFFDETIASNNEWLKNKTFPYNIMHLQASTNYLNGNGRNGTGNSNAWQMSDIGRMHLAQTDANAQFGREQQALKLKMQMYKDAGEEVPQEDIAELKGLKNRQQEILKEKYDYYKVNPKTAKGTAENPIDVSKMGAQQIETMPHGTVMSWKDPKTGETVTGTRDWLTRPNSYAQQPQQAPDYGATQAALANGGQQPAQ
jgi:hypothetical protein